MQKLSTLVGGGLRLGRLGSATNLAIAFPSADHAHDDAGSLDDRTGWYATRNATSTSLRSVVHGQEIYAAEASPTGASFSVCNSLAVYTSQPGAPSDSTVTIGAGVVRVGSLLVLASGTAEPATSMTGALFFRTDSKELRVFDGTAWTSVASNAIPSLGYANRVAITDGDGALTTASHVFSNGEYIGINAMRSGAGERLRIIGGGPISACSDDEILISYGIVMAGRQLHGYAAGTATGPSIRIGSQSPALGFFSPSSGVVAVSANGSRVASFHSGGLFAVGANGAVASGFDYATAPAVQIRGQTAAESSMVLARYTTEAANPPTLILARSRGTPASPASAQNGDVLARLSIQAATPTTPVTFYRAAELVFECFGSVAAQQVPTKAKLLLANAQGVLKSAFTVSHTYDWEFSNVENSPDGLRSFDFIGGANDKVMIRLYRGAQQFGGFEASSDFPFPLLITGPQTADGEIHLYINWNSRLIIHSDWVRVPLATNDPTTAPIGAIYYDTSNNRFRGRTNSGWVTLHS